MVDIAKGNSAAYGAIRRHSEGNLAACAQCQHGTHDLGDDVTRAPHDDRIANQHPFSTDFVCIVKGRIGDRDATHKFRLQPCHRGKCTSAAHLDVNPQQPGAGFFGGEFVCDGKPGRAGIPAKLVLQGNVVDLEDHAVDIKGQRRSRFTETSKRLMNTLQAVDELAGAAYLKSKRFDLSELGCLVRLQSETLADTKSICQKTKSAAGGDFRV